MHWQELQDGEDLNPQDYVNEEDNAHDHVQDADDLRTSSMIQAMRGARC